jgi:hypothetical protein
MTLYRETSTEEVSGVEPHCYWFGLLGVSSNEEDAAQSEGKGVNRANLIYLCII